MGRSASRKCTWSGSGIVSVCGQAKVLSQQGAASTTASTERHGCAMMEGLGRLMGWLGVVAMAAWLQGLHLQDL